MSITKVRFAQWRKSLRNSGLNLIRSGQDVSADGPIRSYSEAESMDCEVLLPYGTIALRL